MFALRPRSERPASTLRYWKSYRPKDTIIVPWSGPAGVVLASELKPSSVLWPQWLLALDCSPLVLLRLQQLQVQ